MNNDDFNHVAGSLRALEEAFLCLTRTLEMTAIIDGPKLTDNVKGWAHKFRPADPDNADQETQLQAFHKTIQRLTLRLEQARQTGDPAG